MRWPEIFWGSCEPPKAGHPATPCHAVTDASRNVARIERNDLAKRLQDVVLGCPVVHEPPTEMTVHAEPWMVDHLEASARSIR